MNVLREEDFVDIFFHFICHLSIMNAVDENVVFYTLCITCPITYTVTVVTPPIIRCSRNKPILSDMYQSFLDYRFPT